MKDYEAEFTRLLQEIRAGSQEAARIFVEEYGEHLLRVIRRKLQKNLRPKFDSCDFLQDVFASFFHAPPSPDTFATPEAFLKYLTMMASNKVNEVTRHCTATQRGNVGQEQSMSAAPFAIMHLAQGPTPSEVFIAEETKQRMEQSAPGGNNQQILELLRLGYNQEEIAERLGLSRKTVYRLVRRLLARFGNDPRRPPFPACANPEAESDSRDSEPH